MTEATGGRQTVPLDEVVLAQASQLKALMNVLERHGGIQTPAVLAEIKAGQAKTPTGRSHRGMCGRVGLGASIRVGQLFDLANWPDPRPATKSPRAKTCAPCSSTAKPPSGKPGGCVGYALGLGALLGEGSGGR